MAQVACGSLAARTSTGTQTVSGLAFTPKVVLFWGTIQTANGFGPTGGEAFQFLGWSSKDPTAIQDSVTSQITEDNVNPSNVNGENATTRPVSFLTGSTTPTVDGQASLSSWNSDGFTLNWTAAASSGWQLFWLAIGGTDLGRVSTQVLTLTTSAGSQSITQPGFRPSLLLFSRGLFLPALGLVSSALAANQVTMYAGNIDNKSPSDTNMVFSPGNALGSYRTVGAPPTLVLDFLFSITSIDPLGFTLTKSTPPAATRFINYLAIEGGGHQVGVSTVPVATGVQAITTTFKPDGGFLFSGCRPSGSASQDLLYALGGFSTLAQGATLVGALDAKNPTVCDQYTDSGLALVAGTTLATPSADSTAIFDSVDLTNFALNWTAVSGNQEEYAYWAIGPGPSGLHLLPILHVGA